ncbi:type III secretion effector protein [Pseudomonas sp. RGM2987]|uniref:SpaN/EivJ family type III secretion system needle length determinant n=1 Tax=Pseudomonas sp. RGM2987 TaxID=2930090 RepID=UPI001FD708C9|nr:type III secretion effector protein [Pseudomonas sp. RGM2987]MCJ8204792.1 type III secretion effector protein [Pseudomonas sp. RGM2987]
MKELSPLTARPVQALDPVDDDPMDELHDKLVPAQEDQLPQGVLDLVVALIRPHRAALQAAAALAWPSTSSAQGTENAEPDGARPSASGVKPVPVPSAGLPVDQWMQPPVPQRLDLAFSIGEKTTPSSVLSEPMPLDLSSDTQVRLSPGVDEPLPQAPASFPGGRHARSVVSAVVTSPAMSLAQPLEPMAETLPTPGRGWLQVPFDNGLASGQVTISRAVEEPPRNLTLSPSNAQVLEQLREPFAQAREPAWRLAERDGEQSRHGARQPPDEDPDEQAGSFP